MAEKDVRSSLVLGLFIFLGLAALGYTLGHSLIAFKEFERTVTVKGLAEREYPADIAIWPIEFTVVDNDLTKLYDTVEKNTAEIVKFLKADGFEQSEISVSPPRLVDKLAQGFDEARIKFRYSAAQTITVYSKKIDLVRKTMSHLSDLGKKGVVLAGNDFQNRTEYLFKRLNEIKPEMIEEATQNAREVAEKFAKDSHSRLGKIKQARQGQFSISDRDKNNPHIKKVRVVSTIEYYLAD
jgi:uncharacterized protein